MPINQTNGELVNKIQHIPLFYNSAESQTSALRLILTLFPDWETSEGKVEFIRFTEGKTNTLLKAVKRRPGYTEDQIDKEAVLLRAYGTGTEVIIDRDRETKSHSLLSQHNLAPPLLARLQNGLLYRYIQGRACTPEDLSREEVWRAVARRLGEWHARLPIITESKIPIGKSELDEPLLKSLSKPSIPLEAINAITPGKSTPNLWTVLQKWIFTLPTITDVQKKRKTVLQKELERLVAELGHWLGFGKDGLVFGHCDLLSGNVIIHPKTRSSNSTSQPMTVSFIDYEYATPCPAAFDIANHFAEWGGFDCDYSVLPTRSTRRAFVREYLASYTAHSSRRNQGCRGSEGCVRNDGLDKPTQHELEQGLFDEVDRFRGIPGFFWGIWALIQAGISQIDFDYAAYAEVRLDEYWAWRAETERTRKGKMSERERRWGQE